MNKELLTNLVFKLPVALIGLLIALYWASYKYCPVPVSQCNESGICVSLYQTCSLPFGGKKMNDSMFKINVFIRDIFDD
ncbi:MAG: hypothetical protein PHP35_01890 [Candidatus Colwellbacteria bacterium]|nr:hypothetical protein [Candidatus Colwellbacteria bacterium]